MKDIELDVVGVMQRYVGNLHDKKARTHGGEWAGKCPLPGCTSHDDSFLAWPYREEGDGPLWWCRQCRQSGRLKKFLRLIDPQNYNAVCEELGISPDTGYEPPVRKAPPALAQGVNLVWVSRACEVALECKARLWDGSVGGNNALKWLRARGFTDAMIDASGFGFNPVDRMEPFAEWGLPPDKNRSGIWFPAGILIPWRVGGEIVKLEIRRADATVKKEMAATGRKAKYVTVQGSSEAYLYGMDTIIPGAPVLLTEGVFDARAFRQAIGLDYAVGVVATGSAGKGRPAPGYTNIIVEALKRASIVLLALDPDAAGDTGADGWLAYLGNAHIWQPFTGSDINAMLLAGDDIPLWFETGLEHYGVRDALAGETEASVSNSAATAENGQHSASAVSRACASCGSAAVLHTVNAQCCDVLWCATCALHEFARGNNRDGYVYSVPTYDFAGVPGYEPDMFERAALMAAWIAPDRHELARYILCFTCQGRATHFDLHGRLWCEGHAPQSGGMIGQSLPYEPDGLESCSERCFLCDGDIERVDAHTRIFCAECAPPFEYFEARQLEAITQALARTGEQECHVVYCHAAGREAGGWCAQHITREAALVMSETLGWRAFPYGDGKMFPVGKDAQMALIREIGVGDFSAVYAALYRLTHHIPTPQQRAAAPGKRPAEKLVTKGPRCSYTACNHAAVFIDAAGVGWCDSPGCSLRFGFLLEAENRGYPQVQYGEQPGAFPKPLILREGRDAYLEFARRENWMSIEKIMKTWGVAV